MNANRDAIKKGHWDKERIKAELRFKGYSLRDLDRKYGYATGHFSKALVQPLRKAEKIIADILGVHPSTIWPLRYGSDGRPHQGRFLPRSQSLSNEAARQDLKGAGSASV